MNKFFTTLMAFALGVTAVNAQQVKIAKPGGELNINRIVKPVQQLRTWGAAKKVANVAPLALPQTRAGEATQHVLGYYKFYTTPDPSFGMEFQTSGYVELAVAFMPPSFGKCLGGTVSSVRVAFADRVTGPTVYVYKMTRSAEGSYSLDNYTPVATGTRPYTSAGWNEFELDNPVTLGAEDGYVVSIRMRVSADEPTIFTDQPIDPDLEDVNGLYMIGEAQTPTGGTQKVMVPAMDADGDGVSDGGFGNWMIQCIVDGGQFSGNDGFDSDFNTIQVGYDTLFSPDAPRLGVAFSYTNGDSDFGRGESEMDAYSLAVYGTKMFDNGMFVDVIGRVSTIDNDMTIDGHIDAKTDNIAWSLSGEYGWRFDLTKQVYVEPQAELAYTRVDSDSFKLSDVKYELDSTDSLIGRVGVAAGLKCPNNKGDVYLRVSGVHEFLGDAEVSAKNSVMRNVLESDGKDTWVEFNIGANFNINESTYVYADVERTEGAKLDEDWRANLGVRYSF